MDELVTPGERGPKASPDDSAYRAIHPSWIVEGSRISSAAFKKQNPFSVCLESLLGGEDSSEEDRIKIFLETFQLGNIEDESGVAAFNCGEAELINFFTHHEPENGIEAHAHVYFDGSVSQQKKRAKKLAALATQRVLLWPSNN